MSETPEHLAVPFTITKTGAATVEQDTPEDVTGCVYNVAVCPEGFREDQPSFGVPELAWQAVPLDLPTYEAAIQFWERRAALESSEMADGIQRARQVSLEVST